MEGNERNERNWKEMKENGRNSKGIEGNKRKWKVARNGKWHAPRTKIDGGGLFYHVRVI